MFLAELIQLPPRLTRFVPLFGPRPNPAENTASLRGIPSTIHKRNHRRQAILRGEA